MNIREIAVSRLKEYENNPRNNDLAVEKVKYSIERFGFLFPIVIDMNYVIVCGHTRVRACRELGIMSVPCIIADELTEEQINLFRLVDNKSNEYTDWDFEKLKEELSLVDLTLEKNQILLDRFELSTEVFDIDAEQAEIKIPTYNFMGDTPKERKPSVSTISSPTAPDSEEDDMFEDEYPDIMDDTEEIMQSYAPVVNSEPSPVGSISSEPVSNSVSENMGVVQPTENSSATNTKKPAPVIIQFRFGDIAFFISQVELDMMNDRYAEYIDSGAMLEKSFAEYLLEGVESRD